MSETENIQEEQPQQIPQVEVQENVTETPQEEPRYSKIEHLQPESNTSVKRVYFTNVPYDISEDDFSDFLKEYEPISVLIPYQYIVKFGNRKTVQPLGVAYADFVTPEAANKVVLEVAGKQFPERRQALRVKLFEAYDPKKSKADSADTASEEQPQGESQQTPENDVNQNDGQHVDETKNTSVSSKGSPKLSQTWVYVTKLANGTLDIDLSKHFQEFSPSDIYVFKFKPNHHRNKFFNKVQLSAIMKFPEVEGIEDIASHISAKMTGTKLNNSKISVKPSFEKKVIEVVNAAKIKEKTPEPTEEVSSPVEKEQLGEQDVKPEVLDAQAAVSSPNNDQEVSEQQNPSEE
ncbi:hypothetical protein HANVADRAFT_28073 [Hanseniaspora valbyensis NRRL Y-1626]|uniref:RRM domain-containing protein n=1 Tax=Hanseniaspora valbyensis NRRL Y-1626 TaxID=766949 RepID=A0A1B7T7M4_9ASCO|nr:hypothetical protein HANVADRAFT_28073 [Hanseniaspora valbyensis NRRL Y-1626]